MSDPAPGHPVRHMADGTATTRRVRAVVPLSPGFPDGTRRFNIVTSWAGDTRPLACGEYADLAPDGTVTIHAPRWADREAPQFLAGIRRRVRTCAALTTPSTTDTDTETPA